jgi:Flp pilus assembly protein TadG
MSIRRRRKPARGAPRRGQSVVELALMMPLLALIMIGTLDLARAYFYYIRLTDSVVEGAVIGVHTPQLVTDSSTDPNISGWGSPAAYSTNNDSVKYRVKQESSTTLGLTNADITVTCYQQLTTPGTWSSTSEYCNVAKSGDVIQIRASYRFRPITTQLMGIVGSNIQMSKTVRMVIL